jgi:imidazolonepropionase
MQVYEHIKQLLTLQGAKHKQGRHTEEADLSIIEDAAVVVDAGSIAWLGKRSELPSQFSHAPRVRATGSVWIPALVECHTHLVFAGDRALDFSKRCGGMTYQQIASSGGGILSTVKHTREASSKQLLERAKRSLHAFAERGVACVEIKSGYGLSLESELKILETIQRLQKESPLELIPTFLPAHAIPPEFKGRTHDYVSEICKTWIPEVSRRGLAVFFDVFLEDGYFNARETRTLCEKALEHGLKIKLHADQFTDQKGAELAVALHAQSCDHLENVSPEGIRALAKSNTVAVLAPGASLFTGTAYPPARALIDAGAQVALTTDFNPGTCPSHSLPLMMTLACTQMQLTLAEALVAATFNAAAALGKTDGYGTIEVGKPVRVWQVEAQTYQEIAYAFGETRGTSLQSPITPN